MSITIRIDPSSQRSFASARQALSGALSRLASGDRIGRAASDAAGLALSEGLRGEIAGAMQGVRNLGDGIGALRIAEGALDETASLLGRLRELSVQAGNGTLGASERKVLQHEADQLTAEISRIAHATHSGGQSLLDGSAAAALELADGTGEAGLSVALGDRAAAALGVDSLDVSDPASLDVIDAAVSSLATARVELGAGEQQLESSVRSLSIGIEGMAAAESRIRDTDFAVATSELTSNQILSHSGLAVQVQADLQAGGRGSNRTGAKPDPREESVIGWRECEGLDHLPVLLVIQ